MKRPFNEEAGPIRASSPYERKLKPSGSEKTLSRQDTANINSDNCIACPKGDEPMHINLKSTLSANDVQYIKNLLAEGIARMLVEKVAKNTAPAVDSLEPERYNPSPQKEVSS